MRLLCRYAASLVPLVFVGPAGAATVNTSFLVQIIIQNSCVITSSNNLDFGTHGVLSSAVNVTTTLSVQCTSGHPYSIGLSAGGGAGATTAIRKMTGPAPGFLTIDYSLYKDIGRTQVWGDAGGELVSTSGTGSSVSFTIYGRVPVQATPPAETYSDTVQVTVTY